LRLGLLPRPHWGSLLHSPRPIVGFKGPTSKGGRRMGKEGNGKRVEGEGRAERGERPGPGLGK